MIPSLSLVLPAFNEAGNIREVAQRSLKVLEAAGLPDFEVIVVDDGSTDGTRRVVEEMAGSERRLRLLSHDRNMGLGAAVRTGFVAARMDYVCRMDADGQMHPEDIVRLLREGAGTDMIVSAYTRRHDGWLKRLLSWGHRWALRMAVGVPYAHQGAYLVRTKLVQRMELGLSTGLVGYEILARVYFGGGSIFQGQMEAHPRLHGESKVFNLRTIRRSLQEAIALRRRFAVAARGDSVAIDRARCGGRAERCRNVVLVKLAIGLSMLALVVGSSNWKHLLGILGSARLTYVAGALALLFFTCLIGVIRWQVLIGAFSAHPSLFSLGRLSLIGLFFNTFVPGGLAGDLVRGYHLGSGGVRRSDALASVFADRLIGLIGLLIVSLIGFGIGYRELMASNLLGLFLAIALGLVGAVVLFYSGWVSYPVGLLTERFSTSADPIRSLWDAIQSYRMCGREMAWALALTFVADLLVIISVYVLAQSIRVALPFHYFLVFVPVIAILSAVPISINGVGVREAGYLLLFTQVGLSQEQALSISLLYFSMTLVLGALGGGAYLLQALISPSARVSLHSKESPIRNTSADSPRTMS